ncbi:Transcription factor 21 [Echinococcus granulosus]|nr:Transcription factor 21 [Echinococcus granulosus]
MDRFVLMPPPPPPSPPQNSEYQHQKRQQQTPARPAKRRGRKPGLHSSAIQRNAANARERSRMRVLSTAFMELKSVLPWVPRDTKLSKLDTLKLASGYITYLKRILDDPEAQDSLSTVSPPFTDSDPLFGTMMKGSTSRMKNSHEEQLLLQKLERKKPQIQYTCVDAQVVQTCPTWWTWYDGSMGYFNDPTYVPLAASATITTTDSLIVSSSSASSSSQPCTSTITTSSQQITNSLPSVVFQRHFFQ